jgi:hypothetical protein
MQLPLSDGRAVRMLQALYAAADPLGRLDDGADLDAYDALAAATLAILRDGARTHDIVVLLQQHGGTEVERAASIGQVIAFARAATDWWVHAEGRWAPPSATVANDGQDSKVVSTR